MINRIYQEEKHMSITRAHTRKGVRSFNEKRGIELKIRYRQVFNNKKGYVLNLK
jgi:hypothetical protein